MKKIILTTPEGYFEKSFQKTIASAAMVRRHRRKLVCSCAFLVLAAGTFLSVQNIKAAKEEKEYLAQQDEIAELDIFLEVNQ